MSNYLPYWHIGRRIRQGILKKKRAAYGDEILFERTDLSRKPEKLAKLDL